MAGVLLEPALDELVQEAGLAGPRGPDHQELEQVVVGVAEAARGARRRGRHRPDARLVHVF